VIVLTENDKKKETVESAEDDNVEVILVVAEGCDGCKDAIENLPKDEKIKILDVTKDLEAAKIVRALEIFRVPLLVSKEKLGNGKVRYCTIEEDGTIRCVEEDEKIDEEDEKSSDKT